MAEVRVWHCSRPSCGWAGSQLACNDPDAASGTSCPWCGVDCYPGGLVHEDDGDEQEPDSLPDDLTPNQVFGVGGSCRRGGEHQYEPDWRGRGFDYLKCRWCGKREAI